LEADPLRQPPLNRPRAKPAFSRKTTDLRRRALMLVAILGLGTLGLGVTLIVRPEFAQVITGHAMSDSVLKSSTGRAHADTKSGRSQDTIKIFLPKFSGALTSLFQAVKKANAEKFIDSVIDKYSGISTSVCLIDLNTGCTIHAGVQAEFTAASTTKVITAAYFLNLVEQGKASLNTTIGGSSASSLLRQMINQSDNTAWRGLKSWMGYDNVEAYAHQIGLSSFAVYDNTIAPTDDALLLQKLYQGQLLNAGDTALLLSYMQDTNNEDLIPAALSDGATVYHKYGLLNDNLHDTAIIKHGDQALVLVIYTDGSDSSSYQQVTLIHQITQSALALF